MGFICICMSLRVFLFAKKIKFLTKGGIHCIPRSSLEPYSVGDRRKRRFPRFFAENNSIFYVAGKKKNRRKKKNAEIEGAPPNSTSGPLFFADF